MKNTRVTFLFLATVLVAQLATAQMMGGGHHGGSGGSGGMNGGGMTGGGMTGGGMSGGNFGSMMGQGVTVGSDGVVYTLRTRAGSGTASPAVEVVAIRPSGTIAWSTAVDDGTTRVKVSGNLLLVASGAEDMGMDSGTSNDDENSELVALSTASGSVQWKLDIDGFVTSLEPFAGGTYISVASGFGNGGMNGGTGGMSGLTRTLLAVGPDGKVLWTVQLSK